MNHDTHFWEVGWHHNHYFLAFYGLLAYIIIEWSNYKDIDDNKHRRFNFKQYARERYDNWLASLILTPIIVWFGPELLKWANQFFGLKFNWSDAMYLGVGALAYAINRVFKKAHKVLKEVR